MNVLADLGRTLWKMFAADLPMTLIGVAVVILVGAGVTRGVISSASAPFILTGGVLAALVIAVARGARR